MGEGDAHGAFVAAKAVAVLLSIFYLINLVLVTSFHTLLPEFFSSDGDVIALASYWMLFIPIFTLPDSIQGVATGIVRGLGYPTIAAISNISSYIIIGFPLSYCLTQILHYDILGIWVGSFIGFLCNASFLLTSLSCINWEKAAKKAKERANNEIQ